MSYDFADRLIELRRKKGMSQEELAGELGLSRQAISKWERAESAPDIGNLVALSELYGVSLDDIVRGVAPESDDGESSTEAAEVADAETVEVEAADVETVVEVAETPSLADAATGAVEAAEAQVLETAGTGTVETVEAPVPETTEARTVETAGVQNPETAEAGATETQIPVTVETGAIKDETAKAYYDTAPNTNTDNKVHSTAWQIFPYPLLCIVIYLFLGFFCNLWHPGWIIFITIPFYYWIVRLVLRDPNYIASHQNEGR